jgi:hypothetical protein
VAVAFVLVVTVASAGTLVVFGGVVDDGGGAVAIEAVDLTVRLNDEGGLPDVGTGNGTVQTCLGAGTPGDTVSVLGDVTASVPAGLDPQSLSVLVELVPAGETTTASVEDTGTVTASVFWLLEDDETLAVGEPARLAVEVRKDGERLAGTNRTVAVEADSRTYDCRGPGEL